MLLAVALWALAPGPSIIQVRPSETGVPPTVNDSPHVVALPANPRRAPTVVFFPATDWQPIWYRTYARTLAANGWRVIVLGYPNLQNVDRLCREEPDQDAHGKLRREILFGGDWSPHVEIPFEQSIIARLNRLILWLRFNRPRDDWNLSPLRVSIGGHSQGGGHAAFWAQEVRFRSVFLIGATEDRFLDGRVPLWTLRASATPLSAWSALSHASDGLLALQASNWNRLGVSRRTLATASTHPHDPHEAIVLDERTPLGAHGPVFAPLWVAQPSGRR